MRQIQFIEGPLSPQLIVDMLQDHAQSLTDGAYTLFCGRVRADINEGVMVKGINYSCYESMAVQLLENNLAELKNNYTISEIFVLHSIGFVPAGGISVMLMISAPHRKQALEAQEALLPIIKFEIPIWKKEIYEDGSHTWTS